MKMTKRVANRSVRPGKSETETSTNIVTDTTFFQLELSLNLWTEIAYHKCKNPAQMKSRYNIKTLNIEENRIVWALGKMWHNICRVEIRMSRGSIFECFPQVRLCFGCFLGTYFNLFHEQFRAQTSSTSTFRGPWSAKLRQERMLLD